MYMGAYLHARRAGGLLLGLIAALTVAGSAHAAAPGSLDASFGTGGVVTTSLRAAGGGGNTKAVADLVQPDGKTVVAGYTANIFVGWLALVRYNTDGSLDPSFGSGGIALTQAAGGTAQEYSFGVAIAQQSDGKLVVSGGYQDGFDVASGTAGTAIVRYNSDGSIDTSFGTAGIVKLPDIRQQQGAGGPLLVQRNGDIVVAGSNSALGAGGTRGPGGIIVARTDQHGNLDPGFGNAGRAQLGTGTTYPSSIAEQHDGKLVMTSTTPFPTVTWTVSRLCADGSPDPGWGGTGQIQSTFTGWPLAGPSRLAIQRNDKVLAVGAVASFSSSGFAAQVALARYNTDGSPDSSFGQGGAEVTTFAGAPFASASSVVLQRGDIVVGGLADPSASDPFQTQLQFAVGAFKQSDGSIDTSFGSGGATLTQSPTGGPSALLALVAAADGKLVAAGYATVPTSPPDGLQPTEFAVARYNGPTRRSQWAGR